MCCNYNYLLLKSSMENLYKIFENAIVDSLNKFKSANWDRNPFGHLVIDQFLPHDLVEQLNESLQTYVAKSREEWKVYNNPLEKKAVLNEYSKFPKEVYSYFLALNSEKVTSVISSITGIDNLIPDVGLHGGGVHMHTQGGKLNVHQDYSLHPRLGLQRRLNIILYLNKNWNINWGGGLGLYTEKKNQEAPDELIKTVDCIFNRAVLFDTAPGSWHGLPDPILCPDDVVRVSLAFYYTREPVANAPTRGAVRFAPTPEQASDPAIAELILQRSDPEKAAAVYRNNNKTKL
jgi:Rps23 Pro-64 3,4-dihydroxylase Tpa1-like proline 4-hydroxylase